MAEAAKMVDLERVVVEGGVVVGQTAGMRGRHNRRNPEDASRETVG